MNSHNKTRDIDLKELFEVIKKRIWIISLITLLSTLSGMVYNWKLSDVPSLYQTSSRIIIGADEESRKTLQVVLKDSVILDKVIDELNLKKSTSALAGQITVTSVDNSQVVNIAVMDPNPERAATIANKTAEIFRQEVPTIIGQDYVRVLSKAKVSLIPINENKRNMTVIALIIGIIVGTGFVFFLDSLDGTIRSKNEVEVYFGIPVLGSVSKIKRKNLTRKKNNQQKIDFRGDSFDV